MVMGLYTDVGSNPFVHAIDEPVLFGRLANAGNAVLASRIHVVQYGSQL